jgi:hypothetical protein
VLLDHSVFQDIVDGEMCARPFVGDHVERLAWTQAMYQRLFYTEAELVHH